MKTERYSQPIAKEKDCKENAWQTNDDQRSPEFEQHVSELLDKLSDSKFVKVYDKSGRAVFSGNLDQLILFWKNNDFGEDENIGSIEDENGENIFRFGPVDGLNCIDKKRIKEIFQQLESKIAGKDHITNIEEIMNTENLFDENKSRQIVDITKDWVKYGGGFYHMLTGKYLELEKGVDYKISPQGAIDQESRKQAKERLGDDWLQVPENKDWLASCSNFMQDHKQELKYEPETLNMKLKDGTVEQHNCFTSPYICNESWLHYVSNYFDKQECEFTQPNREIHKFRIYINVDGCDVFSVYQDIIKQLNENIGLQKFGFEIKTSDVSDLNNSRIWRIIHQRDRIVLYLGENGLREALPILQKYVEQNRSKFDQEGVLLTQPLLDSYGKEISSVGISSNTKGKSPDSTEVMPNYETFSVMQAKIIESCFRSIIRRMNNPKIFQEMSKKYPVVATNILNLPSNSSTDEYIKAILSDQSGEELLIKNLIGEYSRWSKKFGMSENNIAFKKSEVREMRQI